MLNTLAVYGYRTLRDLVVPVRSLNLVTGPNGGGKSNLYRALRLLAEIAQGMAIGSLAREGGFGSTLWTGPERISRAMLRGEQPVEGAPPLIDALQQLPECNSIMLTKSFGDTTMAPLPDGVPSWQWPARQEVGDSS